VPRGARQAPNGLDSAETDSLREFLTALASLLVQHGVTTKQFGELSRWAFAKAAANTSRLKNGKINRSRIAAKTGLSRADVGRLLRGSQTFLRAPCTPLAQVLDGWREDSRFTDRSGRPRSLPITGRGASFATLAANYAKDIPHRAVLEELLGMGAVREKNGVVTINARRLHQQGFCVLNRALTRTIRDRLNRGRRNSSVASRLR
jgi:hypothetical protein